MKKVKKKVASSRKLQLKKSNLLVLSHKDLGGAHGGVIQEDSGGGGGGGGADSDACLQIRYSAACVTGPACLNFNRGG